MGRISRILSYLKVADRNGAKVADIKHDPGGGMNQTSEHFQPANTDSVPLPDDYIVAVSVQRTGGSVVVGFIDPKQEQIAEEGEHRTYARGADGAVVVQLHLKAGGAATLSNEKGAYTLNADGSVDINGFIIGTDGAATSPVSMTAPKVEGSDSLLAAGKEIVGHAHAGSPTSPLGPISPTGTNI